MLTTDQSGLYAQRIKMAHPDEFVVLPEVISKEPLGPLVRKGGLNALWNNGGTQYTPPVR